MTTPQHEIPPEHGGNNGIAERHGDRGIPVPDGMQIPLFRVGEQKGKAEGMATGYLQHAKESVFIVLNERGFSISSELEDRTDAYDNLDQLNQ